MKAEIHTNGMRHSIFAHFVIFVVQTDFFAFFGVFWLFLGIFGRF